MLSLLQRQAVKPAYHTPPTPREHYRTGQACQQTFLIRKEAAEILFCSLAIYPSPSMEIASPGIPWLSYPSVKSGKEGRMGGHRREVEGPFGLRPKVTQLFFSIYLFILFVCLFVVQ